MKDLIIKEAIWLVGLALAGLILLPLSIYIVGNAIFGQYGGAGLLDFYAQLIGQFLGGEPAVVFLLLSPYLLWQLARLTIRGFRDPDRRQTPAP